ncbi:MAG: hypothetical protein LBO66_09500 [Deltaproteobacteria bacterium]|jgi:hypothetical protein|nr:hypothetical protein [Deltaproteobacteria bacterium]
MPFFLWKLLFAAALAASLAGCARERGARLPEESSREDGSARALSLVSREVYGARLRADARSALFPEDGLLNRPLALEEDYRGEARELLTALAESLGWNCRIAPGRGLERIDWPLSLAPATVGALLRRLNEDLALSGERVEADYLYRTFYLSEAHQ